MSRHATKRWLLAYDVGAPARLRRLHALLSRNGCALQHSLFALALDDSAMQRLIEEIDALIDPQVDDIRAWHVPAQCPLWLYGPGLLPGGIELHGTALDGLFAQAAGGSAFRAREKFPTVVASRGETSTIPAMRSGPQPRSRGD